MTIQVEAPDNTVVQFPDGTSHDTILAVMRKNFGAPSPKTEEASPRSGLFLSEDAQGNIGPGVLTRPFVAGAHLVSNILHPQAQPESISDTDEPQHLPGVTPENIRLAAQAAPAGASALLGMGRAAPALAERAIPAAEPAAAPVAAAPPAAPPIPAAPGSRFSGLIQSMAPPPAAVEPAAKTQRFSAVLSQPSPEVPPVVNAAVETKATPSPLAEAMAGKKQPLTVKDLQDMEKDIPARSTGVPFAMPDELKQVLEKHGINMNDPIARQVIWATARTFKSVPQEVENAALDPLRTGTANAAAYRRASGKGGDYR